MSLTKLKHGESTTLRVGQHDYQVSYHARPSTGDSGARVPGATVGEYTVTYPGGQTSEHYHGPHANTEGARKRGANPNAKGYAASEAMDKIVSHANSHRMGFNDRRSHF